MQITVLFYGNLRNIILIIFSSVYLITISCFKKPDDLLIIKETTTATPAATSLNKRINEQNNSWARALQFLVHFFADLNKTTTQNDQVLCCPENVNLDGYFFFRFIDVS